MYRLKSANTIKLVSQRKWSELFHLKLPEHKVEITSRTQVFQSALITRTQAQTLVRDGELFEKI